jgi:release factor glutamine methyltransferase
VVADIGTGSGALAVTVAAHLPAATVYGVDISAAALAVARQNGARHGVAVDWRQGDLAAPLLAQGVRVDLLLANLPYIPTDETHALDVARHEPMLALDGGPDGLDVMRRLLADVPRVCAPNALVLLEIASEQGAAALAAVAAALPQARATLHHDLAGHERLVAVDVGP